MSNHNYSQYSNNKKKKAYHKPNTEEFVTTVEAPVEPLEVKMEHKAIDGPVIVNETVDTVTLHKTITGVVAGCAKLNVRSKPAVDADILLILDANAEIMIDPARSTNEWVKITTAAGVDGFCMRKFVTVKA